jgi:hypothetical protein
MGPVVVWAIGIGSGIFGLGMISAIASRRQRSRDRYRRSALAEADYRHSALAEAERILRQQPKVRVPESGGAMKEAASGREEYFAQISGNSR